MSASDNCCSLGPYFRVHEGRMEEFRQNCEAFVERTASEEACLYYGFSFNGNQVHCREGYRDAAGLLAHLENVGDLLDKALTMADLERLEIHGPEKELDTLREPLKELDVDWFVLEYGFRKA